MEMTKIKWRWRHRSLFLSTIYNNVYMFTRLREKWIGQELHLLRTVSFKEVEILAPQCECVTMRVAIHAANPK